MSEITTPPVMNAEPLSGKPLNQIDRVMTHLERELLAAFEDVPDFRVEAIHGSYKNFNFEGYEGAVLIMYNGSSFEKSSIHGAANQRRTAKFALIIAAKCLNGVQSLANEARGDGAISITSIIETCRLAVQGKAFGGATGFAVLDDEHLADLNGQIFIYGLTVEGSWPALGHSRPSSFLPNSSP